MVYIGMSGGDSGNSDFVSAVNATLGNLVWHWNVIPVPGAKGYNTWGNHDAYLSAGGAIWDSVSIDPRLNQLYVGTGNPVPWNTRPPGKDLWGDSVVALNASTGKFIWGYQTVHHDIWDDDIPATPVLFTGKFRPYKIIKPGTFVEDEAKGFYGGHVVGAKFKYTGPAVRHDAVAEASKMGFMFILDRKTGKPLIPTPEMKTNQTDAAGLYLNKTQPVPVGGQHGLDVCPPVSMDRYRAGREAVQEGVHLHTDQHGPVRHDSARRGRVDGDGLRFEQPEHLHVLDRQQGLGIRGHDAGAASDGGHPGPWLYGHPLDPRHA